MTRIGMMLGAMALLVPAASGQQGTEEPTPGAALHAFRFRWPVPCEARVTEVIEATPGAGKKVISFRLRLERAAEEGRGLVLRIDEVEHAADQPDAKPPAGAPDPAWMEKLRPNLRIWEGGKCLGAVDFEKAVEKYLADVDKEERGFQREFLERNPVIRQTVEAEVTGFWVDWAGRWNGLTIAEGGNDRLEMTEMFPDGLKLPMSGVIVNYGAPEDQRRHVQVSYEAVLEGDTAMLQALEKIAAETPKQELPTVPEDVRRRVRVRATLESATLRPIRVVREVSGRGMLADGGNEEFSLRREWTFEWTDEEQSPATPRR